MVKLVSAAGNCNWYYNTEGRNIFCPDDDEVVVGPCGSGRNNDCNDDEDSHGIHCCKIFTVDDD